MQNDLKRNESKKSDLVYQEKLKTENISLPDYHVVLGSGYGQALECLSDRRWKQRLEISFADLPGFPVSTVVDHAGKYRIYEHISTGRFVQFQMGRVHGFEGHLARLAVEPVMVPRRSGVQKFILTNASGGLDAAMKAGDAVLINDHLNFTGANPLTGENPAGGPRFPDMGNAYDTDMRVALKPHLLENGIRVFEGPYIGVAGPSFETHFEIRVFSALGAKAVGMSTVWEVIALRHSGAKVCAVSLVSNLGAGLSPEPLSHEDVLVTSRNSAAGIMGGIQSYIHAELSRSPGRSK